MTVQHLSLSVLLYRTSPSFTTLRFQAKRYRPFLTQLGADGLTWTWFQGTYWYHSHFKNQYCDGLRGALIIEDPEDPQMHLYDVDDGEIFRTSIRTIGI
jgi:hypothetical protein